MDVLNDILYFLAFLVMFVLYILSNFLFFFGRRWKKGKDFSYAAMVQICISI